MDTQDLVPVLGDGWFYVADDPLVESVLPSTRRFEVVTKQFAGREKGESGYYLKDYPITLGVREKQFADRGGCVTTLVAFVQARLALRPVS